MKPSYLLAVGALFLGLAVTPANAQVIYENFNYTLSANLDGQNGGTGFSAAWATPGIKLTATITAGLTFGSNFTTSGNAALVSNGFGDGSNSDWGPNNVIGRAVTTPIAGTYWQSHLINISDRGADVNFAAVGTGNSAANFAGVSPVGYNGTNMHIRSDGSDGTYGSAGAVVGTTYLMLAKYSSTQTDAWMFTLAGYDTWVAGGATEGTLSANAFNTGMRLNDASFTGGLLIGGYAYNAPIIATIDEIRFGSTVNDVTTSPIPEPSTFAAFAGLAALGLAASRRRRA